MRSRALRGKRVEKVAVNVPPGARGHLRVANQVGRLQLNELPRHAGLEVLWFVLLGSRPTEGPVDCRGALFDGDNVLLQILREAHLCVDHLVVHAREDLAR